MYSKYLDLAGIAATVIGFEDKEDGTAYPEPVDVTFTLGGETSSKILLSLSIENAKQLARALGGAIQHVENERRRADIVTLMPTPGEQS